VADGTGQKTFTRPGGRADDDVFGPICKGTVGQLGDLVFG